MGAPRDHSCEQTVGRPAEAGLAGASSSGASSPGDFSSGVSSPRVSASGALPPDLLPGEPAGRSAAEPDAQTVESESGRWAGFALTISWQVATVAVCLLEAGRLRERLSSQGTVGVWWHSPNLDGTFLLPLILLGPFCWLWQFGSGRCRTGGPAPQGRVWLKAVPWQAVLSLAVASLKCIGGGCVRGRHVGGWCVVVAVLALLVSQAAGRVRWQEESGHYSFAEVTPVIHDEFSYLLQARTLLAGRWSWDSPPQAPELFHQLHVLNAGRFASRYLPGTGAWIAPWEALQHPQWGQAFAQMLIPVGVLLLGMQLGGPTAGILAGLLTALSPGVALFSRLLLSHHPCLVGLLIFLNAIWPLLQGRSALWSWPAGCGLALAMLCRPLTAAAVALPFGVLLVWRVCRQWFGGLSRRWGRRQGRPSVLEQVACAAKPAAGREPAGQQGGRWTCQALAGLAVPLALGLGIWGWQNLALTGSLWTSAYSRYNELYTPRHVLGFHQTRAKLSPALHRPAWLADYDDWARDLDLSLALSNVGDRLRGSWEWSLGLIPLLGAAVYFVLTIRRQNLGSVLIFCSIVCLHLAYFPYWLNGILKFHYVFESGPLWLVLLALVSVTVCQAAWEARRRLFPCWWGAVLLLALGMNFYQAPQIGDSRLQQGVAQLVSASAGYRTFVRTLETSGIQSPALVLVRPGPGDLHVQYVRNAPPFDDQILVVLEDVAHDPVSLLTELFPERSLYRYDTSNQRLTVLSAAPEHLLGRSP
jgi:hypothetical protein